MHPAHIVLVVLIFSVLISICYSFSRFVTVILYSWLLGAFSSSVYSSLVYATFKEKHKFTILFLFFQVNFKLIALSSFLFTFLIWCWFYYFVFLLCTMFSTKTLLLLAVDIGGIDLYNSIYKMNKGLVFYLFLFL